MGILGFIGYMFSYRRKVHNLRKKYDGVREQADTQPAPQRLEALRILDQVEPTLAMLEEQKLSGSDKFRLSSLVVQGIRNAEVALKQKQNEQRKFGAAQK